MALGLMRGLQPLSHVSISSSNSSRRGWSSSRVPSPWLLLLCVVGGYLWGSHNSSMSPYQLEQDAFLPPPKGLQQQQQQQGGSGAAVSQHPTHVQPPALHGDSSSSSSGSEGLLADRLSQQLLSAAAGTPPTQPLLLHPPLTPGRSGQGNYTVAPFQVLSWYPRVILFPNFLSAAQCDYVIRLAADKLQPSELGVADVPFHPGATRKDGHEVRNSHGVFLDRGSDPRGFLEWLEQRIASVSLIPPSHGEDFNVLRYNPGQHYNSHMDTFDPTYLRHANRAFGQRMATFLMYLSDVEEGGETVFKHEGKYGALRPAGDRSTCGPDDFKVKPRRGDAILFWSLNHDLTVNPRALHGACPVVKGEKWVATKWLHDKPITEWDAERDGQQH